MTSLIFGAVYLAHQGVVHARHEKKRVKNYERWEGLRDEYDEQRRTQRSTQSLDLQRTGQPFDDDRPILTLRDQQEAGDARTGWRPQEVWHGSADYQSAAPTGRQSMDATSSLDYDHRAAIARSQIRTSSQPGLGRSASLSNGYNTNGDSSTHSIAPQPTGYRGIGPMRPTATGANWDDGLPRPLAVQKRNFDDQPATSGSALGRSASLRTAGSNTRSRSNLASANSSSQHLPLSNSTTHTSPIEQHAALAAKDESANINNPFAAGNRFDNSSQITSSPTVIQGGFPDNQFGSRHDSLPQVNSNPAIPPYRASNDPFESHNRFDHKPIPPVAHQQQQQLQPQMTSNNPFEPGNRFDSPNGAGSNPFGPMSGGSTSGATQAFAQQIPGGMMATLVEAKTPAGEKDMSEWWK